MTDRPPDAGAAPDVLPLGEELRRQLRPAVISLLLLTGLTGLVFPLALAAVARPLFRRQANGSLVIRDGRVIGSELIGQPFSAPGYFRPRASAAGAGYDALASGGTNLGPANPKLRDGVAPAAGGSGAFPGVRALADAYRHDNGLLPDAVVPIDAATRSGSGLDPHISPSNADLQVPRVARARRVTEQALREVVAEHTRGPDLGLLGERRVAVLSLNLALDRMVPLPAQRR